MRAPSVCSACSFRGPAGPSALLRFLQLTVGLAALTAAESRAADVSYYSVTKGQGFLQTNATTAPALKVGASSFFSAQIISAVPNTVFGAFIAIPSAGSRSLFSTTYNGPLGFADRAASPAALNGVYPDGSYTFSFSTVHDGGKNLAVSLTGSAYPNVPQVSGFAALQAIDSTAAFSLAWNAFTAGTAADFIQLRIEDSTGTIFSTGALPGATNALNGTAGGVTIPAHTFVPGRTYLGHLLFEKITGANATYAGATGQAAYWRQTDFYVTTSGSGDATPPTILALNPANGAVAVPLNIPLTVTFSKPMGTGFSMSVGGTTNAFYATWSADRRTCTVASSNLWPANTTLNWTFNPSPGVPLLGDQSHNPLLSDLSTSFTTGSRALSTTPATPAVMNPGPPSNGVFRLVATGDAYRTYICQTSADLLNWLPLATNQAAGTQVSFTDSATSLPGPRFYRLVALP